MEGCRASDEHRGDLVARRRDVLAEQVQAGPHEAAEQEPKGHEGRCEGGGVREEDVHGGLAVGPMRARGEVVGPPAVRGGLAMVDDRVGRDR